MRSAWPARCGRSWGSTRLYVADLRRDRAPGPVSIRGSGSLARESQVIVDAGSADVASARALLDLAVAGVVVGSETLPDARALTCIRTGLPGVRLIVSLDLRGGRVVTRADDLRDLPPADALARVMGGGLHEAIVLDLDRVRNR
ncbi:MAG: HisA/HisF-related TIM barrel protein [Solirubrobacterales bacterium]